MNDLHSSQYSLRLEVASRTWSEGLTAEVRSFQISNGQYSHKKWKVQRICRAEAEFNMRGSKNLREAKCIQWREKERLKED